MPDIKLKIEIQGLDKLVDALKRYPQVSIKHIDDGIKKSMFEIEAQSKPRTPVSEGRLRGSYRTDLTPLRGEIGPTVNYAAAVHEGTRPHWPPWGEGSALNRWARLHDIPAFLVARAISRRGTKAVPFLLEGVKAALPQIKMHLQKSFGDVIDEIARIAK
jgi:hypothetical protein